MSELRAFFRKKLQELSRKRKELDALTASDSARFNPPPDNDADDEEKDHADNPPALPVKSAPRRFNKPSSSLSLAEKLARIRQLNAETQRLNDEITGAYPKLPKRGV